MQQTIAPETTNYLIEVGVPIIVACITLVGVVWAAGRKKK